MTFTSFLALTLAARRPAVCCRWQTRLQLACSDAGDSVKISSANLASLATEVHHSPVCNCGDRFLSPLQVGAPRWIESSSNSQMPIWREAATWPGSCPRHPGSLPRSQIGPGCSCIVSTTPTSCKENEQTARHKLQNRLLQSRVDLI